MKAVDTNLLELLKKSERFVVPIYQRVYSWGEAECEQLWLDITSAGARQELSNHFTGSIVYIEGDQGTLTSREPHLLIDGQQRVTTVLLLLTALAERLDQLPEDQREPIPGFAPQKIRGLYLTNPFESGDAYFKLTLSQRDRDAFKAVVKGLPLPPVADSRVVASYQLFVERLRALDVDALKRMCRGLDKLVVVDVKLTRGLDDPQMVFESMNATGKKLSQADLIRNFVLMGLLPNVQRNLYEDFWFPMENRFQGANEKRFDEFVRHYLTIKTNKIPRLDEIYDVFKVFALDQESQGKPREDLVRELSRYAEWFAQMALGAEPQADLARRFEEIEQLATVTYPFQLRLYAHYDQGVLSAAEFAAMLDVVIAYLFRRVVCRIPTNSLNRTFAALGVVVDPEHYVESIIAHLLTLPDHRRFPKDDEFEEALRTTDLYHSNRVRYFFRTMENHGRKEKVSIDEYTIEHIMPQNLTPQWKLQLGDEWESIHEQYLHTLGNLTLTGYNPEYSNRPFHSKRDMEGGFAQSPLRVNHGLGQLEAWNVPEIEQRAQALAARAVALWPRPGMEEAELERYRDFLQSSRGFDWSRAHAILAALPAGRWTSYNNLAEAVGTSAQPMARHVASCTECVCAYRVLTWNGRIAGDFRWVDTDDDRNPADVLTSEGVTIVNGRADVTQILAADELLALIDVEPS
jgi:uncharacterized protein with ParB-like and HNH nuclease domain/alkylated DNA nucleotide flippase Atl1